MENPNEGSFKSSDCTSCKPGYYNPIAGQSACKQCDAGYENPATGATLSSACTQCKKGYYGPTPGLGSCIACGKGQYSISVGATLISSCIDCDIGYYNDIEGKADSCTICPPGTFNTAKKQSICLSKFYYIFSIYIYTLACLTNCKICYNTQKCITCNDGFFLKHSADGMIDTCPKDCGLHFYTDFGTKTCMPCDYRCLSCNGPANTQCTVCDTSINGVISQSPSSCICGQGFYTNEIAKSCDGNINFIY